MSTTKTTEQKMWMEARQHVIPFGPQVGGTYLFRTPTLYWIGKVYAVNDTWVILEPGSSWVVLTLDDDPEVIAKTGKSDHREWPNWSQLQVSLIIEFTPIDSQSATNK